MNTPRHPQHVKALASAIGIAPVTVAGVLLMACGLKLLAWTLLIASATFYFVWIMKGRQ